SVGNGAGTLIQGTLAVSVGETSTGVASFVVSDDTGSKVAGGGGGVVNCSSAPAVPGGSPPPRAGAARGGGAGGAADPRRDAARLPPHESIAVTAGPRGGARGGPFALLLSDELVSRRFSVPPTSTVDRSTIPLNIPCSPTLPNPALQVVTGTARV